METIKVINYVIMVIFFACYAYQFLYIPIAWLKKQKPLPKGLLHRYAVLIAARNEETVIGSRICLCRSWVLHRQAVCRMGA